MPHTVFLSHASPDRDLAGHVCQVLERRGIACWVAYRDALPGTHYPTAITQAIAASRLVVVVVSQAAGASQHVLRELEGAVKRDIPILPLRIDAAPLSGAFEYLIGGHNWVDAQGPLQASHLERLADAARTLLESEPAPAGVAGGVPHAGVSGRRPHGLLVVGALLALAGAVWIGAALRSGAGSSPASAPVAAPAAALAAAPTWFRGGDAQRREARRLGVPVALEHESGMRFVLVPGGTFSMGSPDDEPGRQPNEGPVHQVTVSSFYLAVHEATNAQIKRWKPDHDSGEAFGESLRGGTQPAVGLQLGQAREFASWLRETGGRGYRLPTEAEWEYACRAGTSSRWFWGDSEQLGARHANGLDAVTRRLIPPLSWVGWPQDDGYRTTAPTGSYEPNSWGLFDMLGNVYEIVDEAFEPYTAQDVKDPRHPNTALPVVVRGGAWYASPGDLRCARRASIPGVRPDAAGVRIALSVGE